MGEGIFCSPGKINSKLTKGIDQFFGKFAKRGWVGGLWSETPFLISKLLLYKKCQDNIFSKKKKFLLKLYNPIHSNVTNLIKLKLITKVK